MSSTKNASGRTQTGVLTYEGTEGYLQVGEHQIHYHEAGTEHADTVVFLHGGGPGASGWFNFFLNIEPFAQHFRTILIDFPNYGRSGACVVNEDNARFNARVLSEFLRAKGIERASLMGNSMGGAAAIAFSVHHNEQLDMNVLMGAATGPSIFDVSPPHGVTVLMELFRAPTRDVVERMMHLMVHDDSFVDDEFIDMRWGAVQDAQSRGFLDAMGASRKGWADESAHLGAVANPTLVVYGAHDRFAAFDSSVSLLRRYPNSELHVFRNCGHWVQFELADEFNELVISWLLREKAKQAGSR